MLRAKHVCAVVMTGLIILLAAGCSKPTPDVQVPSIVDLEELRSGTSQHTGNLLVRMNESQWNEANVEIVEGDVPATTSASLLIFEIPTLPSEEFVRFLKPNCPPCYNVTFTYYGWQCRPTSACIGEGELPPCAEIRFLDDRIVCFGSCPNGGTCQYRAIRLRRDIANAVMQYHSPELTAIWIAMMDPEINRKELFAKVSVIGYYCGCN